MALERLAPRQSPLETETTPDMLFAERSLHDLALSMREYPLPCPKYNYPEPSERLYIADPVAAQEAALNLPDGSWRTGRERPDTQEHAALIASSQALDAAGRPVHPWILRMLADPTLGVATGKGEFYHWGANHTADPIIFQNGHVLLILRDNGQWAFSGGFVDPGETGLEAAAREAGEEAEVEPGLLVDPTKIYEGAVADLRMTAHAWTETSAFAFKLPNARELAPVRARDDARDARWFPIDQARSMTLWGSHNALMELAVAASYRASERVFS